MSVNSCSTFNKPRPIWSASTGIERDTGTPYDFITLLAAVQKHRLAIITLLSPSLRQPLGTGGTSDVVHQSMSVQTSFAFKGVSDLYTDNKSISRALEIVINEITILSHPSIRVHPNIAELQGICWNISIEHGITHVHTDRDICTVKERVWPVLIFERSQFGDLSYFASTASGRHLDIRDRLALCGDVYHAVASMHSLNIVHGDLKPQNVLVFKNADGKFTAKVTDFGYSAYYGDKEDQIHLPISEPWQAPEYNKSPVNLSQARKMDLFSFGLVSFWLLFEQYLSSNKALPDEDRWQSLVSKNGYCVWKLLNDLKTQDSLVIIAHQLLRLEDSLSSEERKQLERFFESSLCADPELRTPDLSEVFGIFGRDMTMPGITRVVGEENLLSIPDGNEFEIVSSISDLYSDDYRLRAYVTWSLEQRVATSHSKLLAIQLALCYYIGLGCARNVEKVQSLLTQNRISTTVFDQAVRQIRESSRISSDVPGSVALAWVDSNNAGVHGHFGHYVEQHCIQTAMPTMRRELGDLRQAIGPDAMIVMLLDEHFTLLLFEQGQWSEATESFARVMNMKKKIFGEEHRFVLDSMENLALTYSRRGNYESARCLQLQVLKSREKIWGDKHIDTARAMGNLASTCMEQGHWTEAEDLQKQRTTIEETLLGLEHPRTLVGMSSTAHLFIKQARWTEAAELCTRVLEIRRRTLTDEHPDTLLSISQIAFLHAEQGQWSELARLSEECVQTGRRLLGECHPVTLNGQNSLAVAYNEQGRWGEAERLHKWVLEKREEVCGLEHPQTLISMTNLAWVYMNQQRLGEAQILAEQVVKQGSDLYGNDAYQTLTGKKVLVRLHLEQGRWSEAEEIQTGVLNSSKKFLGNKHPVTLAQMEILAEILGRQDRYLEAETLDVEAMKYFVELYGLEHPDTLACMGNFASRLIKQSKWKDAEKLYKHILPIRLKTVGPLHISTLTTMGNLAVVYNNQGKQQESIDLQVQVVESRMRILGPEHPQTLTSTINLSVAYKGIGRLAEAEELQRGVVAVHKKVNGEEHPDTVLAMIQLACTIKKQQDRDQEALDLLVDCLGIRTRLLGSGHKDVWVILQLVKEWQSELAARTT